MDRAIVRPLQEVGRDDLTAVGGKAANLGMMIAAGLPVPPGFCVTTEAFRQFVATISDFPDAVARLSATGAVRQPAHRIREQMQATPIPTTLEGSIVDAWQRVGPHHAYAVRSSATAEDLPDASFAGQQETYLDVVGRDRLLDRVRACWASLFTERACVYRNQNGIPHREVALAVVVQQMVRAEKSGVLFTADPATGQRTVTAINAGFGLGDALVSGVVSPDLVRADKSSGEVISMTSGDQASAANGSSTPVLDPTEVRTLVALGQQIETLLGSPQDIEWCFAHGGVFIVQARPITTLYPRLEPPFTDASLHVCLSVSHLQVMTDAMPPLAFSLWRWVLPLGRMPGEPGPSPWVKAAGGRIYADVSAVLRRRGLRRVLLFAVKEGADPLVALALAQVTERPSFTDGPRVGAVNVARFLLPKAAAMWSWVLFRRPEGAADRASALLDTLEAEMVARVNAAGGTAARLDAAVDYLSNLIWKLLHIPPMIGAGLVAGALLRRLVPAAQHDLPALGRGLVGNVTTAMALHVGDLADVARDHPELATALQHGTMTVASLERVEGGADFRAALEAFLERYGMRGTSEIDISRDRWRDDPSSLLRTISGALGGVRGHHRTHHRSLIAQAEAASTRIIDEAGKGAMGWFRRPLARRLVRVHRHLLPIREHPKYMLVRGFAHVRTLVRQAASELVQAGRLRDVEDVWFLEIDELVAALREPGRDMRDLVATRRTAHTRHATLTPPRVLTSEGESPVVELSVADLPEGALPGRGVSAGEVVGPARVITDPTREVLQKGEVLVARFTDPGWTPLFINASGLVMEVGGLMTHGSVVAREYGIPAVVSVRDATRRIRTGQRIKVQGEIGYVQILDDDYVGSR